MLEPENKLEEYLKDIKETEESQIDARKSYTYKIIKQAVKSVAMWSVLWTESHWIDLQKARHMAPTYRQSDSIPNELRKDSYALATRRTGAITPLWLQPGAEERGVARTPGNRAEVSRRKGHWYCTSQQNRPKKVRKSG